MSEMARFALLCCAFLHVQIGPAGGVSVVRGRNVVFAVCFCCFLAGPGQGLGLGVSLYFQHRRRTHPYFVGILQYCMFML
jgi:hypothetical protein